MGEKADHKKKVILSSCIEDGIVYSRENSQRIKELRQLRENSNIGRYYASYLEKKRIKAVLQNLFAGTEYEDITDEIQNLIEGKKKTPKVMYLNSLHVFGRKSGLEIYNKLKACDDL